MQRGYTLLWRKVWANPLLCEPGKKFSRLEAWLYLTNVLATGVDDEAAGLKRGEFIASVRFLAKTFNWSHAMAQRFVDQLLENSMIARVIRESIRPAIQEAGHFIVCNYETYNPVRYADRNGKRYAERYKIKEGINTGIKELEKDTHSPASRAVPVSPKILLETYQQQNQSLPEVKALTAERLRKCRSRIDQAVRDGCLEQYLADFSAAVKKAQPTPFVRGEGARGWRASSDWFISNHSNNYAVIEGKYDGQRRRRPTETEQTVQSVARILTASLAELQPAEPAAAIQSIAHGNESEPECQLGMDSGWRRVDLPGGAGMRQCECVTEKARRRALASIPERFRDSSFESFKPRDPKQQGASPKCTRIPTAAFI